MSNRRTMATASVMILALTGSALLGAPRASETALLFSYFTGNGEDGLHLAWSEDGLQWTAVNGGRSCLTPTVGEDRLMRDPSIVRGPDGVFHTVWTSFWTDRIIGYSRSTDLIEWSSQRAIPVMTHEPEARNSWAPELFVDNASGEFWIIWSTTIPGRFPSTAGSSESDYSPRNWVEGPSVVQVDGDWFVYFDAYTRHRYEAVRSNDLTNWTDITDRIRFPEGARHGTVLRAGREVLDGLVLHFDHEAKDPVSRPDGR